LKVEIWLAGRAAPSLLASFTPIEGPGFMCRVPYPLVDAIRVSKAGEPEECAARFELVRGHPSALPQYREVPYDEYGG
jgi:hypothetical protein